jgi:hypothetical protein
MLTGAAGRGSQGIGEVLAAVRPEARARWRVDQRFPHFDPALQ